MRITRATRRTVRRWGLRIRKFPLEDFVSLVRLHMPESDRDVLSAMLNREISRRARAQNAATCPCGGSNWDHQRLVKATVEAARLRSENENLHATLAEITSPQDMHLWRRIAMQRREIKALQFWVDTYRRWWRRDKRT